MTLREILEILEGEVILAEDLSLEVRMGFASDLMSDVLALIEPGSLLLTGLVNSQLVRTAEMAEIEAVCFVRGKRPGQETVELAREKGIALLATRMSMFKACGLLFGKALACCVGGE